jgi:hypothetical protein
MIDGLRLSAYAFVLMTCFAGCGRSAGVTAISGTVSYDGQPVKKGTIAFLPAESDGPTAAATIADGKYSAKVAPGKKLVRIEGYKVIGQHRYNPLNPKSRMVDTQEQFLPDRYNKKSELTRDITPGLGTCDFTLEKLPAAPR